VSRSHDFEENRDVPISPGRRIDVAETQPLNRGVLAYLRAHERSAGQPLSARPGDVADPYYQLGSHPDIVEHVWDILGRALPQDCRCVVLGSPALVELRSGIVLALALGTTYTLRLTPADADAAEAAGLKAAHHYQTSGDVLDVAAWGEGWRFGAYDRRESEWLARAIAYVTAAASGPGAATR
jgi:hypothetical protein